MLCVVEHSSVDLDCILELGCVMYDTVKPSCSKHTWPSTHTAVLQFTCTHKQSWKGWKVMQLPLVWTLHIVPTQCDTLVVVNVNPGCI